MAEEIVIEMAPQAPRQRFFGNRRLLLALAAIFLVLAAALFSWWLSLGKISSASARLDALVYTVAPESAATLETLYAHPGELVDAGQPLAKISLTDGAKTEPAEPAELDRQASEKDLMERGNQARLEEERLRRLHQEAVGEHVRAQLAMRAINRASQGLYAEASEIEAQARRRMTAALEAFEKASRYRAQTEQALGRLRRANRQAKGAPVAARTAAAPQFARSADLVAPATGKILAVKADQGQKLAPGQTVFFILPDQADGEDRWVQAWFPAREKEKLKIGQKAGIRFDASDIHLNGKVSGISPEEQPLPADTEGAQGNGKMYVSVKISLDDAAEAAKLQPGARASCQIQTRYSFGLPF